MTHLENPISPDSQQKKERLLRYIQFKIMIAIQSMSSDYLDKDTRAQEMG